MRNGHKRMRGRNNHRKSSNPLTRVYESNGPDVKIRGTASQVAEKYIQLARDAQGSGDPVAAENYYQHAEHYFRLIAAAQEQFRQQNPYYQQQQQPQQGGMPQGAGDDAFDDGDEEGMSAGGQSEPFMPREQPQPQMPRDNQYQQQPRQQYQPREYQQQQPQQNYQQPQQNQQQPQQLTEQPGNEGERDFGGLPSFITGGAPQQPQQNFGPNGNGQQHDRGPDRFGRHRRRRHRGPRPDYGGQQNQPPMPGEGGDPQPSGD